MHNAGFSLGCGFRVVRPIVAPRNPIRALRLALEDLGTVGALLPSCRHPDTISPVAEIGSNVTGVQGDVSNLDDLDRLYKEVATKKDKLDVLFANAGFAEPKPTPTVTPDHYDKTFDVTARGVFFAVQKALPPMKEGRSIILACGGLAKRHPGLFNLRSNEGSSALVRAHMDGRVRWHRNPREHDQPGPHGDTDS